MTEVKAVETSVMKVSVCLLNRCIEGLVKMELDTVGVQTSELAYITTISDGLRDVVLYAAFQWVLEPVLKDEANVFMAHGCTRRRCTCPCRD